jgi:PAS domain S-box-containing protein
MRTLLGHFVRDIRFQLVALVAGAVLPLLAFVAYSVYTEHVATEREVREAAVEEALQLRSSLDSHLHFLEGVLAALSPLALHQGPGISTSEMERATSHLPAYVRNVMIVDVDGRVRGAKYPVMAQEMDSGLAGRAYFQEALRSRRLVVSEPFVGRRVGRAMFVAALALRGPAGAVTGVMVLAVDATAFGGEVFSALPDTRITAALLGGAGELVAISRPDGPVSAFRQVLYDFERRSESLGGLPANAGENGYGLVRSTLAPWSVVVAADTERMAHERLPYYQMLAAAALALLAAFAVAAYLARRITQPLRALRLAAETFGRGELRHRIPRLSGEVGRVAEAFNAMAGQLEAQRLTIRGEAERFRAVFHNCPLPMALSDLGTGGILEVNAAFTAKTGKTANEVIGKTTAEIDTWIDLDQRARALAILREQGRIAGFECRHRTREGSEADVLMFAELVNLGGRRVIVSTSVDVTERKLAERRIREITKRLTLATRAARIGIWELDVRSRQLSWDDTMLEAFGIAAHDFSGRFEDWIGRVVPEDRAQLDKCRGHALARGEEIDIQYRVVRSDGNVRYLRSRASIERDEQGAAVRLIGTTHDVTETVLGREALARLNSELEARVVERTGALQETVRELEAFSYTVAHDLRAPLRAIDGFSTYLSRAIDAQAPEAAALLAKIRRNVGSMDHLIDGLLKYARLGRQTFRAGPVDMGAIAEEARRELAEAYPGVEVRIDALPSAFGDPDMLRQVWTNLLGNACKFSHGRPAPRVAVGSTRDAQGTVYFVWDNGVGFDMRYRDRLFRVFERLHPDAQFPGAGVGLAVVQRVIHRHSGTVWAEGFPGEGSTFYFRLPDPPQVDAR